MEYAKVRMNGTTFIEESFKDRKDIHQGIYVDIMMLHKVPQNIRIQKKVYVESKFVTLYALINRTNWKPEGFTQKLIVALMKVLPCQFIAKHCYKHIYKY